jgi:glyoxylase-like metal-dependent hydrolase (beta-lactamase superfamily II)
MADYSIWVLEYARAPDVPAFILVHGREGRASLPYSLTVLQSDEHTVLVDTGYLDDGRAHELAVADGITQWTDPVDVLGTIGVAPADVDHVLLTHLHYDHVGSITAFPRAVAWVQGRELSEWIWALSLPPKMAFLQDGTSMDHLRSLQDLESLDRLRLVEGRQLEVLPGITLEPDTETHTFGHQHVVVRGSDGRSWVLPGDLLFAYDNLGGLDGAGPYLPNGFGTGSRREVIARMDSIMSVVEGQVDRVLPGHEERLFAVHPSWVRPDGLRVAEVCLRPGDVSRRPAGATAASPA